MNIPAYVANAQHPDKKKLAGFQAPLSIAPTCSFRGCWSPADTEYRDPVLGWIARCAAHTHPTGTESR